MKIKTKEITTVITEKRKRTNTMKHDLIKCNKKPPRLELPYASRNPKSMAKRIKPTSCDGYHVLKVCEGFTCYMCVFPEEPHVSIKRVYVDDVLSGLRHRLPEVKLECCNRMIAKSVWRGGLMRIEELTCPVTVKGGRFLVWGKEVECVDLRECLSLAYSSKE